MDWGGDGGSGGVGDNVVGGDSTRRGSIGDSVGDGCESVTMGSEGGSDGGSVGGSVGDGCESAVTSMTSRSWDGVRGGGGE